MANHLVNHKPQKLFAKCWVDPCLLSQRTHTGDLFRLTLVVGSGKPRLSLVGPYLMGDLETLSQKMYQSGVDVVDTGSVLLKFLMMVTHRPRLLLIGLARQA